MKLVTYLKDGNEQLACYVDGYLYDMENLHPDLPNTMSMFLNYWEDVFPIAQRVNQAIKDGIVGKEKGVPAEDIRLLALFRFRPVAAMDMRFASTLPQRGETGE